MTSSAVPVSEDDSIAAPFAAQDVLGHEVSAPETSISSACLLALTSGPSQRAAIPVAHDQTTLGALPATTLRAPRLPGRHALPS